MTAFAANIIDQRTQHGDRGQHLVAAVTKPLDLGQMRFACPPQLLRRLQGSGFPMEKMGLGLRLEFLDLGAKLQDLDIRVLDALRQVHPVEGPGIHPMNLQFEERGRLHRQHPIRRDHRS